MNFKHSKQVRALDLQGKTLTHVKECLETDRLFFMTREGVFASIEAANELGECRDAVYEPGECRDAVTAIGLYTEFEIDKINEELEAAARQKAAATNRQHAMKAITQYAPETLLSVEGVCVKVGDDDSLTGSDGNIIAFRVVEKIKAAVDTYLSKGETP